MRRFLSIAFALLIMAALTGCQKTDEDVFAGRAAIDCSKAIERDSIFYVDYDSDTTDNLSFIKLEDLMVGDMIILDIYESELEGTDAILVEDIQLSTQRFD